MDISVALVVFVIKVAIKQRDINYDIQAFFEDIEEVFGEKIGEKIAHVLLGSKNTIDHVLSDDNLIKAGIPWNRIAVTQANVQSILRNVKIDSKMLIDYNCNAEIIAENIIRDYGRRIVEDSTYYEIGDIKKVLVQIVSSSIKLAYSDKSFLTGMLIDIKQRSEQNTVYLQVIENMLQEHHKMFVEFQSEQRKNWEAEDNWRRKTIPIQRANINNDDFQQILDVARGVK